MYGVIPQMKRALIW